MRHSTGSSAMWDLGFLINETPIVLSGRIVRKAEALVLCGISAFLSMNHHLHPMARWSAQPRQ